jgi:hypothetical protein
VERDFPPRSLEAEAADLLREVGREDASAAKQRVRERVMAARPSERHATLLGRGLAFAPTVAVSVLALVSVAGAALGPRLLKVVWRSTGAPASKTVVASERAAVRVAMPARREDTAELAAPPPREQVPAPSARAKRGHAPSGVTETELLFEAARALRRDRDPGRAGVLLDGYFRQFPNGTLGEEALALAVEAASARGDARSVELARRYLARYPHGQFRGTAERALASGPP